MQKYVIALYIRLSIEDYKYDSLSIENQSLVLHEYAASMPEALNAEIMEFIDNGYSGTNFERPQVQKLIELVRANQIDCIIVKDFSRFGRNSIETGYFIERVFPLFHTRFISISDDFDSSKFKGDRLRIPERINLEQSLLVLEFRFALFTEQRTGIADGTADILNLGGSRFRVKQDRVWRLKDMNLHKKQQLFVIDRGIFRGEKIADHRQFT